MYKTITIKTLQDAGSNDFKVLTETLKNYKLCYIDDINRKDIKLMSPEDYSKIVKEKVDLFKLDDNTLYHNISDAIVKKKPLHFRSVTCASQTNGYVLDPLGHIYPC